MLPLPGNIASGTADGLRCCLATHRPTILGAIRACGFAGFYELFNLCVTARVLRDSGGPAVVPRLAEMIWPLNKFWLASAAISGAAIYTATLGTACC